jgi:ubiquinone/menaquinone biosynthesis C-methylase UbiE
MMQITPTLEEISRELLTRSTEIQFKDGSQGLDTIASLHQYHLAYKTVTACVPLGSRVLDWGGGSGHFSLFLHRRHYITTIYSFSPPSFVDAEIAEGKVEHVKADSSQPVNLPFADNSFDAVCSIGVLEHVRETAGDERSSLREIERILKPGGVFICYHLPNRYSWIEHLAKLLRRYHHQFTYDEILIKRIFEGILKIDHFYRYALLPRNSLRHLPAKLANHRLFVNVVDKLDSIAAYGLRLIAQNWLIVARKKELTPHGNQSN